MNIEAVIASHLDIFCDIFRLKPDEVHTWGKESQESTGFDDDNDGVQWNTAVNREGSRPASGDLGVNFEGKKYGDWPIDRLIRGELRRFSLFNIIATIEHPENIMVRWTRDVWANQRMRVDLQPFLYVPLSELRQDRGKWERALLEAQACLGCTNNGCNRAWQMTTWKGVTKQREVTPHLTFIYELWRDDPRSKAELKGRMLYAKGQLRSLYSEMGVLSKRI